MIFVNGCFWHKHEGCKYFVWPKNNAAFWREKILSNVERDQRNYEKLNQLGWNVIVVWECELKKELRPETLNKIIQDITRSVTAS